MRVANYSLQHSSCSRNSQSTSYCCLLPVASVRPLKYARPLRNERWCFFLLLLLLHHISSLFLLPPLFLLPIHSASLVPAAPRMSRQNWLARTTRTTFSRTDLQDFFLPTPFRTEVHQHSRPKRPHFQTVGKKHVCAVRWCSCTQIDRQAGIFYFLSSLSLSFSAFFLSPSLFSSSKTNGHSFIDLASQSVRHHHHRPPS